MEAISWNFQIYRWSCLCTLLAKWLDCKWSFWKDLYQWQSGTQTSYPTTASETSFQQLFEFIRWIFWALFSWKPFRLMMFSSLFGLLYASVNRPVKPEPDGFYSADAAAVCFPAGFLTAAFPFTNPWNLSFLWALLHPKIHISIMKKQTIDNPPIWDTRWTTSSSSEWDVE